MKVRDLSLKSLKHKSGRVRQNQPNQEPVSLISTPVRKNNPAHGMSFTGPVSTEKQLFNLKPPKAPMREFSTMIDSSNYNKEPSLPS